MPHIHEAIDFIVDIFIVHDGKILLILHKKLNRWIMIGGHIELNEDPDEALFREVQEECGLEIEVINNKHSIATEEAIKFLYIPMFVDIHAVSNGHKHIRLGYVAKATSGNFVHNKEEHNDIRWFSEEELDDPKFNVPTAVKFYAKEALKMAR